MNEKDPRAKRTIESLKEALKNLMLKKEDYYDISIKELCEEANINRRTFYLHFASIDEVLVLIQEEIAILFKDAARKIDYKKDCKPLVKAFFDILSNDPLYEKIFLYPFNDHLRFSIAKYFIKFNKENNTKAHINGSFYLNSIANTYNNILTGVYREWVINKKTISKEEAVSLASNIINHGYSFIYNL